MYIALSSYPFDLELVYEFYKDLSNSTDMIRNTHQLTLDKSRPYMGLKGDKGLFATKEWWDNINEKNIPSEVKSGVIVRTYNAGMENSTKPNSFTYIDKEGNRHDESIYLLDSHNYELFNIDHYVVIFYAYDEMKSSTIENPDYCPAVIEMAVSKKPLKL